MSYGVFALSLASDKAAVCATCGKGFELSRPSARRAFNYCSCECSVQAQVNRVGAYAPGCHAQTPERRAAYMALTQERLKELLTYEPDTGLFKVRVRRGRLAAGSITGKHALDGRVSVSVGRFRYRAHRLAWLYMTGNWPVGEIDHIDGDPSNNRWVNLRDVTSTVNKQNLRRAPRNKRSSPLLGACWNKQSGKWASGIRAGGKHIHLGLFETDVEASKAYIDAKRRLHEGCTI